MIPGRWIDEDFDLNPRFEGVAVGRSGNIVDYGKYLWLMNERQRFAWDRREPDIIKRKKQWYGSRGKVMTKIRMLGEQYARENG